jgi:hypothetical protein
MGLKTFGGDVTYSWLSNKQACLLILFTKKKHPIALI